MNVKGFFISFFLVLLLLMLTLKMKLIFGWNPDLLFALLIALGFAAGFSETFFLAAFSAWILNYTPYPGIDVLFMGLMPLAAFIMKKFVPWRHWMSLGVLVVGGLGIRYLFVPGAWSTYPLWLTLDILLALGAAFFFVEVLESFHERA